VTITYPLFRFSKFLTVNSYSLLSVAVSEKVVSFWKLAFEFTILSETVILLMVNSKANFQKDTTFSLTATDNSEYEFTVKNFENLNNGYVIVTVHEKINLASNFIKEQRLEFCPQIDKLLKTEVYFMSHRPHEFYRTELSIY
jgi:hypothetical protein